MSQKKPSDEVWSAPESGTVRGPTSGNQPSRAGERPQSPDEPRETRQHQPPDDVSSAPESGTARD
jgi:hypothetical protein